MKLRLHAFFATLTLWTVCRADRCMAQLSNFCCGVQVQFASITSDLSRELEKAEQLIVTTQSQLANEQACSQSLAMALLEARASNEVGSPLFVACICYWLGSSTFDCQLATN